MIRLHNVRYTYPGASRPALDGVSLELGAGELCAVLGPNGAGKSTLCYAIAGFVPHHFQGQFEGEVMVAGRRTTDHPLGELVQHCGLVFDNPLNQITGARFTVREELAFGLENLGVPRAEMIRRIEQVMALLEIAHLAERSPFELSGGQQQRVAIASILVMQPRVLVLDEPTSQLDPLGTREVLAALGALRTSGVTIVLAEHKPELVASLADRVVVLAEGRIRLAGHPRAVLSDPLLPALGVAIPRYTDAARQGRARGLWPPEQPLPVTLEEAVRGFAARRRSAAPGTRTDA